MYLVSRETMALLGQVHTKKARSLLAMAGIAETAEERIDIQRQAQIHLQAARSAMAVCQ